MIVLKLLSVLIFTALLSGCDDIKSMKEDIRALKEDVNAVKVDIRLYKGFLTATTTPEQCPHPGEHTTMICHYTLQIKGPYEANKQKGWFVATVPQQIVTTAKEDCEKVKGKNPDNANMVCPDHSTYPYREFVIYVEGGVKKDEIWHFVNEPITNHLIAKDKVQIPKV
jgi:hypothetical protein